MFSSVATRVAHALLSTLFAFLMLFGIALRPANAIPAAIGYSQTDFLVAGYDQSSIAVYDQNLNFKGYLDSNFPAVTGLDIMLNGNVVTTGQNRQVRVYNPSGAIVGWFSNDAIGDPIDIKASSSNLLYIGTQDTTLSVQEFNTSGAPLRNFGSKDYDGVAILPNNILWAGGNGSASGIIDVYNLNTGALINSISLDNGQAHAVSFAYSPSTNTVLTCDEYSSIIYERSTDGTYIRKFTVPDGESLENTLGVTRGPNNNVYATDYFGNAIYYWNSTGTYLGKVDISSTANGPCNIIWMGNVISSTPNSSVNAIGTLKNSNGSIQVSLTAANNKNGLGGSLSYTDKFNKTTVQSTKVTTIIVQGNQARVSGDCKVNGEAGYGFTATINDYYATLLGRGDSLQLEVSNGYSGGGIFNPGDAKVTGAPINLVN